MARLTISLPETLAEAATLRAATEKRSASSYVALLIERDVQAHAPPEPALAELLAKIQAAAAVSPRVVPRIEAALKRACREPANKERSAA